MNMRINHSVMTGPISNELVTGLSITTMASCDAKETAQ